MANTNTPYIAKAAQLLTNPTSATVFLQQPPNTLSTSTFPTQAAYVKWEGWAAGPNPGATGFQNLCRFRVSAGGRVTGGTTTNFTPSIQFGRNTAAASNTTFATLTATAFNSASGNWVVDASLVWDPVSGQINGTVSGVAGSGGAQTILAPTSITPITGQTLAAPAVNVSSAFSTGDLQFFFCVTGLFSASSATNTASLDFFQVENL